MDVSSFYLSGAFYRAGDALTPQQRYERLRESAAIIAECHAFISGGDVLSAADRDNEKFAMWYCEVLGITQEEATYLTGVAYCTLSKRDFSSLSVPASFQGLQLGPPQLFAEKK